MVLVLNKIRLGDYASLFGLLFLLVQIVMRRLRLFPIFLSVV